MKRGWTAYVWKLLWLVGFIILLNFHFSLGKEINDTVSTTYEMTPLLWFKTVAPFVIGLYIALVFVKRWAWKFNLPLFLCVALPSLLIHISTSLIYIVPIENITYPLWFASANTSNLIGIVVGISLVLSVFSGSSDR